MPAKKPTRKSKTKPKKKSLPRFDSAGLARLWDAALDGDLPKLRKLLKAGIDPNIGNGERMTPLFVAAVHGRAEAVKMLLDHGANPNLVDVDGTAALQLATYEAGTVGGTDGHRAVVALLLRHGADPDHKNKWGATPRRFAKAVGGDIEKLFKAVKPRPAKAPGPGRRAPTPGEASGTADESYYWTRHARLWDELVPPSGQAKTVQGEVIRATGKLTREAYTNGNVNWSRSCSRLWRFVAGTLDDPDTFTPRERAQIKVWVKAIIRDHASPDVSGEGSPYYLVVEKAVAWVLAHPKPIRHTPDPQIKI